MVFRNSPNISLNFAKPNENRYDRAMKKQANNSLKVLFLIWLSLFLGATPLVAELKEIHIPSGSTGKEVTEQLYQQDIIKKKTSFFLYLKLTNADRNLRAGTFFLSPNHSYKDIIDILQEKKGAASLTKVTIPEGFSITEIADTLEKHRIIQDKKKFIDYVQSNVKSQFQNQFTFLKGTPNNNLEGYLFPNTYIFAKGISYHAIVSTFLEEFEKQILQIWKQNPSPYYSLHEMLTLASIIERESQTPTEMTIISGVFHNRLKRGIPLAACPTVGYAIGQPRKKIMTYTDIKAKSPYNTYIHRGLPPTPIASPGKAAFLASLTPQTTKALYFVSNGDGTHTFSQTHKDHIQAQYRIQRKAKTL